MSMFFRQIIRCYLEFRSRISGQGFVCNALQGDSEYNLSINCDMTVSCNCQDDGSGILGSLDDNSFEEIFFRPHGKFVPRVAGERKVADSYLREVQRAEEY